MKIHFKKLTADAKAPKYALPGDAGMDFFANEDTTIKPGQYQPVSTGIAIEIPLGYVGLVWDKSGIVHRGLKTAGGVIDSGYRGDIKIQVRNLSQEDFVINKGDKIAQILIQKVESPELIEADSLSETTRGESRFGSTGIK